MADKKDIKAIYQSAMVLIDQAQAITDANPDAEIPQGILNSLEEYFVEIINFERMYLVTAYDKFYGTVLMNINVDIDFSQNGPVDLQIDTEPLVLSINPLWCKGYKFQEFTGIVISEILKLVYNHPASYSEINSEADEGKHQMLEKASQASISSMVQNDIRLSETSAGVRLPKDAYTRSMLNSELGVNAAQDQSLEYYYNIIDKFSKNKNQNNNSNNMSPMSGQPSQQPNKQNAPSTPSSNSGHQTHNWEKGDSEEERERVKSLVSQVYNALDEKSRGAMPAGLLQQIKVLLAPPEINWKQVLRKLLGAVPVPYRKTKMRLNRRQPYRADLSGRLPKRTVDVVVAIDTSGSMSDKDIEYCMNEIFNITKDYEGTRITIIECDAEIGKVYQAKKMTDVQTKVSGRGGTSFIPVIDFINGEKPYDKNPLSGKFQKAIMIYFTDGYGDYEIPKPKTYRNLWVVLGDERNLSLKEPYGDVKSLKGDKDWQKLRY